MKKYIAFCLAIITVLTLLAGCKKSSNMDFEKVKKSGKLVVGVTDYSPMDYRENGEWSGFDAEFAKLVAEKLGVSVEFVIIDWDKKVDLLNKNTIDCIWNGYTVNDVDDVSFSVPYAKNSQVLVMHSDNANNYKKIKDLTVAVEKGSSAERVAKEEKANIKIYELQKECLEAVSNGTVAACIVDKTIYNSLIHTSLEIVDTLNVEEFGVGFRKDSNLKTKVDEIIKELLADGTLKKLANKYDVEI